MILSMRYRRILGKLFLSNIHAFAGEIWRPGSEHGQFTNSDSGKDTFNMSKTVFIYYYKMCYICFS